MPVDMWTIGFAPTGCAFAHIPTGTTANHRIDVDEGEGRSDVITVAPAAIGAGTEIGRATTLGGGSGCLTIGSSSAHRRVAQAFAPQWLAYALPYRRFADTLASDVNNASAASRALVIRSRSLPRGWGLPLSATKQRLLRMVGAFDVISKDIFDFRGHGKPTSAKVRTFAITENE
jgi:hypothetical protein